MSPEGHNDSTVEEVFGLDLDGVGLSSACLFSGLEDSDEVRVGADFIEMDDIFPGSGKADVELSGEGDSEGVDNSVVLHKVPYVSSEEEGEVVLSDDFIEFVRNSEPKSIDNFVSRNIFLERSLKFS